MGTRDTCRLGRHPEELSRLCYSGHVAHSQASGESITRWTSRRTRELPGGLRRTRRLPGRLAAHSETGIVLRRLFRRGFRRGFRLAFGTRGNLRKFPKEVPSEASKGAFDRASGRL